MRLIDTATIELREFDDDTRPEYAIFSHRWETEKEVSLQDMQRKGCRNRKGDRKIRECCSLAKRRGFNYVWIDTCCITRQSSTELSEAINSMYNWYQHTAVCYAYLADVSDRDSKSFRASTWFKRGRTL